MDIRKIHVYGQIIDAETKKGIPNAEVLVLTWYKNMPFDRTIYKATLLADEFGHYEAYFPKGHKIQVAAKRSTYVPSKSSVDKKQHYYTINLELHKGKLNDTINVTIDKFSLYQFIFDNKQ